MLLKFGFPCLAFHLLLLMFMMNAKAEKSLSTSIQLEETDQVFFHYNDLKLGKKMPIYFGGFKPGDSPICHFLPSNDLVWLPNTLPNEMENSM
ncbi:unnamed protein product [Amaranthus hypochondriacus]